MWISHYRQYRRSAARQREWRRSQASQKSCNRAFWWTFLILAACAWNPYVCLLGAFVALLIWLDIRRWGSRRS